jgi:hypothetical protein
VFEIGHLLALVIEMLETQVVKDGLRRWLSSDEYQKYYLNKPKTSMGKGTQG